MRLEYEYCEWLYRREDDATHMDLFEQSLYYKRLFSLMSEEKKEQLEYMKELEQEMIAMEKETLKMKECFDQCIQTKMQENDHKDELEYDFVSEKTLIEQKDKRGDLDYAVPPPFDATDASIVGDKVNLVNANIDVDNIDHDEHDDDMHDDIHDDETYETYSDRENVLQKKTKWYI